MSLKNAYKNIYIIQTIKNVIKSFLVAPEQTVVSVNETTPLSQTKLEQLYDACELSNQITQGPTSIVYY